MDDRVIDIILESLEGAVEDDGLRRMFDADVLERVAALRDVEIDGVRKVVVCR